MHSRQHPWRTRTTVIALAGLAMSGVAAIVGAPSASAAIPGPVLATGQCSVELFSGPNLTGDVAVAPTNLFSIRGGSEAGDWNLYFDDVHGDLSGVGDLKDRANSVRVTCTYDSVNGNSTYIQALPLVNGELVPDPTAMGCNKAEGVTKIDSGAVGVLKTYVSNQLSANVAGKVSDITVGLSAVTSRTSCP